MDALAPEFYDRQGQPIDLATLVRLKSDPDYRCLARDVVGEVEVVTVWLGTDQSPSAEPDNPLIFGTAALLPGQRGELLDNIELCAGTETSALANHAQLLERVHAAFGPG